jgi:AhpD family alkylhydroperoxidase
MSDRLNYNTLAPAAMKALGGVHVYLHSQADLPKKLIDLAYLRASQINGCAYCIDMHSHDLIAQGVPAAEVHHMARRTLHFLTAKSCAFWW